MNLKTSSIGFVFLLWAKSGAAQDANDTLTHRLQEVVVTGVKSDALRNTPFNVTTLSETTMRRSAHFHIADALSRLPGVQQFSTGAGISKPVIRGLYGNRIETLVLGIRFDNQQWQDEHGLGLSAIGIDRIEVLKGPSSLLYGTEAMGGVINIIEEKKAEVNTRVAEYNAAYFSATRGASLNVGLKANNGRYNWRVRAGMDSHADYTDGAGNRVLNSRFESYNLKASLGFDRKKWTNQNHFYTSFSRFGFVMQDNQDRKPLDGRWSRTMDGPNHAVYFAVLASENTFTRPNGTLRFNGGFHTNLRLENEGGNRVSLNMLLNTLTYNLRRYLNFGPHVELILGNEAQVQTNRNYGARTIIPDANMLESSVMGYLKVKNERWRLESGLSLGGRYIKTFETGTINTPDAEILPFSRALFAANGNVGVSFNPAPKWNLKANASTGYRSPNLAELSSNGLHEGTFRWEVGDVHLKNEQNFNTELNVNYETSKLNVYLSVFNNYFQNYIYLTPTGAQYYGFDIYRFMQKNANLYGGELSIQARPISYLGINADFSTVTGKLTSGGYLPFIPANRLNGEIVGYYNISKKLEQSFVKIGFTYAFPQRTPGQFESGTPDYLLLNAGVGTTLSIGGQRFTFVINAQNLLNNPYFDHLSRFKYFGILNVGQNIYFSISVPVSSKLNANKNKR